MIKFVLVALLSVSAVHSDSYGGGGGSGGNNYGSGGNNYGAAAFFGNALNDGGFGVAGQALVQNGLGGQLVQLSPVGDGFSSPVSAAISTRRSYEVRPVMLQSQPAVPSIVDVQPSEQPVQVIFRTQSSPVMVQQIHTPSAPAHVERTNSEDEPHRVLHQVVRPVIQEVREIIQPFRRVTQEVRPVVEEVHTVVAKSDRQSSGGSFANQQGGGAGLGANGLGSVVLGGTGLGSAGGAQGFAQDQIEFTPGHQLTIPQYAQHAHVVNHESAYGASSNYPTYRSLGKSSKSRRNSRLSGSSYARSA